MHTGINLPGLAYKGWQPQTLLDADAGRLDPLSFERTGIALELRCGLCGRCDIESLAFLRDGHIDGLQYAMAHGWCVFHDEENPRRGEFMVCPFCAIQQLMFFFVDNWHLDPPDGEHWRVWDLMPGGVAIANHVCQFCPSPFADYSFDIGEHKLCKKGHLNWFPSKETKRELGWI